MENHPIPQDVTGFQFKLIGEMTIRQFAYLGVGVVVAWIFLSIPLPVAVRIPASLFFAAAGFAFAFLPIDGRPLDTMIVNFLKALTSPDQFIYKKVGGALFRFPHVQPAAAKTASPTITRSQLEAMLYKLSTKSHPENQYDRKEESFLESVATLLQTSSVTTTAQKPPPPPPKPQLQPHPVSVTQSFVEHVVIKQPAPQETMTDLEKKAKEVAEELKEAKAKSDLAKAKEAAPHTVPETKEAHEKVAALDAQLAQLQSQKEQLEKELIFLHEQMAVQKQNVFVPIQAQQPAAQPKPLQATKRVRLIPKNMEKGAGVPFMPDVPNLIVGIIKDPRGNVLPNILVEIKDNDGNPVRAFKTNGVGQFASATSLQNGVYTILFEDPKSEQQFEATQIEAKGEILQPLEVISQDQRELLRQSLFNR